MNARRLSKAGMRATRFMLLTFALQARAHSASASGNLAFNPARRLRGADGLKARPVRGIIDLGMDRADRADLGLDCQPKLVRSVPAFDALGPLIRSFTARTPERREKTHLSSVAVRGPSACEGLHSVV